MQEGTQSNGKAVASLVLGIIAIASIFIPSIGGILGLVCAIVGLVLGVQARKQTPSSMATAGFILCLIALIIDVLAVVACSFFAAILGLALY